MRRVLEKIYLKCVMDRWSLGFIDESLEEIIDGCPLSIKYVTGIPHGKWYADPFILDCNDMTIVLLVEEYRYSTRRGRIAKLVISRTDFHLEEETIILDLDSHLSFPFVQRCNDAVYVSPENSSSGVWNRYIYEHDKLSLMERRICEPLTDAVETSFLNEDFIFSTKIPASSGSTLHVYNGKGIHVCEVQFDSNIARGAGDWFKVNDKIYRPAQDCNGGYGKAVIIQEVIRKDDGSFEFKNVRRIASTHPRFSRGLHTFNNYKGITVVDVFGYRYRFIGSAVDGVKDVLTRILKAL